MKLVDKRITTGLLLLFSSCLLSLGIITKVYLAIGFGAILFIASFLHFQKALKKQLNERM